MRDHGARAHFLHVSAVVRAHHTLCVIFLHIGVIFAAALPTCFVEGISVGVAGRLLGSFCGVHTGIRFNTIQRQRKRETERVLRSGKSSLFLTCSPWLSSSLHPRRSGSFFASSSRCVRWRRLSLLFPVQPLSLLLSARVSLPPSLPLSPYLPSLSLSLSLFNSLAFIRDITCC